MDRQRLKVLCKTAFIRSMMEDGLGHNAARKRREELHRSEAPCASARGI